jgi:hypothetical protein
MVYRNSHTQSDRAYVYPSPENPHEMTRLIRFALNNFTYLLTLFSKFFSSFPHGTCSLSVSRQYLALDGAYHPLSAGIPTNATLRATTVRSRDIEPGTGLSPSLTWLSSRT